MAAILGTGLLALGAYTVHRYMSWRCRELIDLFRRNTVRVVEIEQVESQKKSGKTRRDEGNGKCAAAMEQMPLHTQRQQEVNESRRTIRLRGGFSPESDLRWTQQRRIQPHSPMPAPAAHAQPAIHRRAFDWCQPGTPYEHFWQLLPVFQVPPQGGWYAYIPPRRDLAAARVQHPVDQPRPRREVIEQVNQERTRGGILQQARRERRLDPAAASLVEALNGAISLKVDSLEVVDGYPAVIEGIVHRNRQVKRQKSGRSQNGERRQSLRTDVGTRSSSRFVSSAKEIPRSSIPERGEYCAYLSLQDPGPHHGHTQHTAQNENGGEDPYTRQSHRRRSRRERERDRSVRRDPGWKSCIDDPRQPGTASPCTCICLSAVDQRY